MPNDTLIETVKTGFDFGLSFTKLYHKDKKTGKILGKQGKHPCFNKWQTLPRAPLDKVLSWIADGHNIGLRTGQASGGVIVIDQDPGADPDLLPGPLPETVTVFTGRPGGTHYYYRVPNGTIIHNAVGKPGGKNRLGAPNWDAKGDGGQAVYPGSVHPDTGVVYEFAPGHSLTDIPIAPAPQWVIDCLTDAPQPTQAPVIPTTPTHVPAGYGKTALANEANAVQTAPEHTRNDTLNRAAYSLGQLVAGGVLEQPVVEAELAAAAAAAGLGAYETKATITSGINAGKKKPRTPKPQIVPDNTPSNVTVINDPINYFHRTDTGNASLFAETYEGEVLYDHKREAWYIWNGQHWAPDINGRIIRLAQAIAQKRLKAVKAAPLEQQEALAKFALQSENVPRLKSMIDLAKTDLRLADSGDSWDLNPYLLGVKNGVVDLHTGTLRPGQRTDRITKTCAIPYDPNAISPRWLTFINDLFPTTQNFIGQAVGYTLTGSVKEQVFFMLYGKGQNGKSTFLDLLHYILGDYSVNCQFITFTTQQNQSNITTDLAAMDGARLITAREITDGKQLNESRVKILTGGDPITCRPLRKPEYTFPSTGKIWFAVNDKPIIKETSFGYWRRCILIPLLKQFPKSNLKEELITEAQGILTWAVYYANQTLNIPEEIIAATKEYETDQDVLAQWIADTCDTSSLLNFSYAHDLYDSYRTWAETNKLKDRETLSNTAFGRKISQKFKKERITKGIIYYGISLKIWPM